jgi:putative endonuclease
MLLKKSLGKFGEKIASQYLEREGYLIVEKNYRCKSGEIDIIIKKDNLVAFVEVKTRTSMVYGEPVESINNIKTDKIRKVADFYLAINGIENCQIRFDVVLIQKVERKIIISHIKNAF